MSQLTSDILLPLHSLRRRLRALVALFGIALAVAAGTALLLASALADYLLNLPAVPRLVLIVAAVAAWGWVVGRWLVRPLLAPLHVADVAGRVEEVFPQFDDRLRSTVDILAGRVPGSEPMKQRIVAQTGQLLHSVDLRRAVSLDAVWYALAALLAAGLIAATMALVYPAHAAIALTRLTRPFVSAPWPKKVQLSLVGEWPARVVVGNSLDVRVRPIRGDKRSLRGIVYYQYDDGPVQRQYMERTDGAFAATLDAKADPVRGGLLNVWVRAGDDELRAGTVRIVPRLAINRIEARISPPPYVKQPPAVADLAAGPAVATVGASVALHVSFSKPLADEPAAAFLPVGVEAQPPADLRWLRDGPDGLIGQWTARRSLRFHLRAADADSFTSAALEEYEIIVKPDGDPVVQIDNPRRNEERTLAAVVPLAATAEDDFGIRSLDLLIERLGDKRQWEIPLVAEGSPASAASWARAEHSGLRQRFHLQYPWTLAALSNDLKAGDVLEYQLRVRDNFELDGAAHAPAFSGKLRLSLISQEELTQRVNEQLRAIAGRVGELRTGQNRTREETLNLLKETQTKADFDPADRAAAERLANQQSATASQTKGLTSRLEEIARRLEENRSPDKPLAELVEAARAGLDRAAEGAMKEAAASVSAATTQPSADARNRAMDEAARRQQSAADQLQKVLDRLGNIGGLQQTIDAIRQILADQQKLSAQAAEIGRNNVGKRPDQLPPAERQKLDTVANEQERLSARTAKELAEMNRLAEEMAKSDPAASEAMKRSAQTGQKQQVAPSQSQAARQMRENQQSQAQANQKNAEIGLQMMLQDLREAQKRRLEQLSRKLAELDEQIRNLIRRQAGHNLDNLGLQNKLDVTALKDLIDKAGRSADQPAGTALPQLSSSQEQTERNTRDIGRSLEEADNGSAAADLTRAAGRMERAIVHLRQRQLVEAFAPPQTEALAALEEALEHVRQQREELERRRQQQQRESIREAYEKIRQDQLKVNEQTTKLDAAPRTAEGKLRREDAIRLGQLPDEQSGLTQRTRGLDEALAGLGSVVYLWANQDIAATMDNVKADLSQQLTGKPTQAEQTRIVEQIDAMIRSLSVEPQISRFEQRPAGGGRSGGGSSARLPSEAELRLLKELQQAINKATAASAGQTPRDPQRLESVGQRQGQLRNLLDELLKKSSGGKLSLPPEPDNRDALPEEATAEAVTDQELERELLEGPATDEKIAKDTGRVGDRMARSRQRLAINHDPGKTTQTIQQRILTDLDELIQAARQQQSMAQGSSQQSQPGDAKPMKPSPGKPANQGGAQAGGAQPAQESKLTPGAAPPENTAEDIRQTAREWGNLTQRQREAVIEGASESVIEKYRKLTDDYYRSLATKAKSGQ